STNLQWLAEQLYQGLQELADQYDCVIAGGDTNSWEGPFAINVTLTGSLVLLADLIRCISTPLKVTLVSASSYGGTRTTAGKLTINESLLSDLAGRDVLLLDD
ncbi:MAG: AIR synthase related protein, partial [Planctomyces sp.]